MAGFKTAYATDLKYVKVGRTNIGIIVRRMTNALYELDMLQLGYQADRDLQYIIVEGNKDDKGRNFLKAQQAALRADKDLELIQLCIERRKKIVAQFSKVWEVYTGNKDTAPIVADYLASKGNELALKKKYDAELVEKAMADWRDFVYRMKDLTAARYKERRGKILLAGFQLYEKAIAERQAAEQLPPPPTTPPQGGDK